MFPLDIEYFGQLLQGNQWIIYGILCALNAVLLFFSSQKFFLVLQQCGYRGTRYFRWLNNKETPYLSRLMLLCLLGFLFFCVLNTCFAPAIGETMASYVGFISYALFTILYINSESAVNAKVPLKRTKRLVRLSITFCVVTAIVTFGFLVLFNYLAFVIADKTVALLRFSLICAMPILTPILLFVAYCLNEPYEEVSRRHYVRIAEQKLKNSNVIKIGITGSFAKTSVKEILRTILSQKYRVLATPHSYNTTLGIALTVKNLDSTHDVFIAEMGARAKGDISAIAKMVKPEYGVLTGVNKQHLETFKSEENILNTKYELFENLSGAKIGFFASDNEKSVELFSRYDNEKYLAGVFDKDNLVTATDIVTDSRGTTFNLVIKGEKPVSCSTVLLGKHSVRNICLAAAVAYKIGLSVEEIALGVGRIQSVGHRLQLLPNNKNIVIIDDSYNSNEDGISSAMEVLDTFKGRKIVLTPGLVELGKYENVINFEFGKLLAKHADIVIIVGHHNAETIANGLIEAGMNRENIKFARTLNKGNVLLNEIIKEGDVVMFENDLPDNYS